MHKKKNLFILLVVAIILIIIIATLALSKNTKKMHLEDIKEYFLYNYEDLRELDKYDISMYFGIDNNDIPDSLFMTDFVSNEDNIGIFDPKKLIVIINSNDNLDDIYDIMRGYIDSNKNNYDNNTSLYENAILKKENNYLYLILGENNNIFENKIMEYYN